MKNPWMSFWMSAWLSAANQAASVGRGLWAAEFARQQQAFAREMAKVWGLPLPKKTETRRK